MVAGTIATVKLIHIIVILIMQNFCHKKIIRTWYNHNNVQTEAIFKVIQCTLYTM